MKSFILTLIVGAVIGATGVDDRTAGLVGVSPAATNDINLLVKKYLRQEVVCLNPGEECRFRLKDGRVKTIRLMAVRRAKDQVVKLTRLADVVVEIDGQPLELTCAPYTMPIVRDGLRIQADTTTAWTALPAKAQLSLWDATDPIVDTSRFGFPIRNYRLFSHGTQAYNEVVHLGRGDGDPAGQPFHHSYGMDMAAAEGCEEVDSLGEGDVLRFWPDDRKPFSVMIQDKDGFIWEYAHLASFDPAIVPGAHVTQGQRLGILGKTGPSGNFAHLHVGAFLSRQDMDGSKFCHRLNLYPWLVTAYRAAHPDDILAVARPHQTLVTGEKAVLDGRNSLAPEGRTLTSQWTLPDGRKVDGPTAEVSFDMPGAYVAALRIRDDKGNEDVDFCQLKVFSKDKPEGHVPTIFMTCTPAQPVRAGDEVKVRCWLQAVNALPVQLDLGDGTVKSCEPNETLPHLFSQPGVQVLTATCQWNGLPITSCLKVLVSP